MSTIPGGFSLLPGLEPVGGHRNCIEIVMGYSFGATRHDTSCARGIACIVAFRCAFRPALAGIRAGEEIPGGFRPRRRTGGRARRSERALKMGSNWIVFCGRSAVVDHLLAQWQRCPPNLQLILRHAGAISARGITQKGTEGEDGGRVTHLVVVVLMLVLPLLPVKVMPLLLMVTVVVVVELLLPLPEL